MIGKGATRSPFAFLSKALIATRRISTLRPWSAGRRARRHHAHVSAVTDVSEHQGREVILRKPGALSGEPVAGKRHRMAAWAIETGEKRKIGIFHRRGTENAEGKI